MRVRPLFDSGSDRAADMLTRRKKLIMTEDIRKRMLIAQSLFNNLGNNLVVNNIED